MCAKGGQKPDAAGFDRVRRCLPVSKTRRVRGTDGGRRPCEAETRWPSGKCALVRLSAFQGAVASMWTLDRFGLRKMGAALQAGDHGHGQARSGWCFVSGLLQIAAPVVAP